MIHLQAEGLLQECSEARPAGTLLDKSKQHTTCGSKHSQADTPVCLQQDSWAQVLVLIPPVARAAGAAARTQNALVQAIQLADIIL